MSRKPHPLLAQIPLTVSPYISLPHAPTLPYTYKAMPSTLPPSSTADDQGVERKKYVVAPSGHTAHPDEILASCETLQAHLLKVHKDAGETVQKWEEELKAQDLADKRKVAPGWLDRDEKILEPKRMSITQETSEMKQQSPGQNILDRQDDENQSMTGAQGRPGSTGEELDRAFGGMNIQRS